MDLGMRVDATVHSISELHFLFLIEFLWKCIAPEGIRGGIRLVFTIKEGVSLDSFLNKKEI